MNEEILTINVILTGTYEVKGTNGIARMILFEGDCDCSLFKGKILPGGVDTQKELQDKNPLLSARYILEGTDFEGQSCRIFIENNGEFVKGADNCTHPIIITDSKSLSYLEEAELFGTIEGTESGVRIHIFRKK